MNKLMQHAVDKFAKDFDSAAVAALVDQRVLAERERCAQIADAKAKAYACEECADIAAAIRSGK